MPKYSKQEINQICGPELIEDKLRNEWARLPQAKFIDLLIRYDHKNMFWFGSKPIKILLDKNSGKISVKIDNLKMHPDRMAKHYLEKEIQYVN